MSTAEYELRGRISHLLQSIEEDHNRTTELFRYIWNMTCVRRGLMTVIREFPTLEGRQVLLQEVQTGRKRRITRPIDLDPQIESMAVETLARILGEVKPAG